VSEAAQSTKVEMSAPTALALRERGGNLYISTVGMGMLRTSMNSPDDPARFDRFSGDGWSVYVDRDIEPPTRWVIKWTRWPRPHFSALHDPPDSEWSRPSLGDVVEGFLHTPLP
jgi:hypothetical protein